jgi:Family of unknown function (DUF5681)
MATTGRPVGNPNISEIGRATRFKPGQPPPNPGGRPKGVSITKLVRDQLLQPCDDDPKVTKGERLAETVMNMAAAGDKIFAPLVWRYMDGDPKAASDLTLRELAEQLAERLGLDPAELLGAFERDQQAS